MNKCASFLASVCVFGGDQMAADVTNAGVDNTSSTPPTNSY